MSLRSHLFSNNHLREKFLNDQEVCFGLLDTFRNADNSTVYTVDGKIRQVIGNAGGTLRPLTSEEIQARWLLLVNNVRTHTRRHYKQANYAQASNKSGMLVEWYHVPKIPEHMPDVLNGFYTSQNNVGRWERQLDRVVMLIDYITSYPRYSVNGKQHPMNLVMGQLMWKFVYLDVLRQYRTQGYSAEQPEDKGKSPVNWTLVKFCPIAEKYLQNTFDIDVACERHEARCLEKWNKWAEDYRRGKKTKKQEPQYPTAQHMWGFRQKMALYLTMKESTVVARVSLDVLETYPDKIQQQVLDATTAYDEDNLDLAEPTDVSSSKFLSSKLAGTH